MSYDLSEKILNRLKDLGVEGATIKDMIIILPLGNGEHHVRVEGVITEEKLAKIAEAYKAMTESAA